MKTTLTVAISGRDHEWVAIVTRDDNPPTRVRYENRRIPRHRFRCDVCGSSPTPDCPHARAVVLTMGCQ